jgi:hemerythrin-like domain-containing protein
MKDAVLKTWHAEHAAFWRLLDRLEAQVALFHGGETPDYRLMIDVVSYLREFPDRVHHPREDAAFERMVAHDPSLRLPVNRLLQEHRVLATAGEELLRQLDEVLDGGYLPRESIEASVDTYLVYYRHHLTTEERTILPRAAALLLDEDWRAAEHAAEQRRDPLLGDPFEERYRDLRAWLAQDPGTGR